jgi:hypothetical protein
MLRKPPQPYARQEEFWCMFSPCMLYILSFLLCVVFINALFIQNRSLRLVPPPSTKLRGCAGESHKGFLNDVINTTREKILVSCNEKDPIACILFQGPSPRHRVRWWG